MAYFFNRSIFGIVFFVLINIKAQGQRVADLRYFPDGNRVVISFKVVKDWKTTLWPFKRKVWVKPAIVQPGRRADIDIIKSTSVKGDVGLLDRPGQKLIVWDFSKDIDQLPPNSRPTILLIGNQKLKTRHRTIYQVLALAGNPDAPFGITYARYSNWGWYFSAKIKNIPVVDFIEANVPEKPDEYSSPCSECPFTVDKKTKINNFNASIGINRKISKRNYLYAGLGIGGRMNLYRYAFYDQDLQELTSTWVRHDEGYSDYLSPNYYDRHWSYFSPTGEIGLTHRYKRFFFDVGLIKPLGDYFDLVVLVPTFSIGYALGVKQKDRW